MLMVRESYVVAILVINYLRSGRTEKCLSSFILVISLNKVDRAESGRNRAGISFACRDVVILT